MGGSKEITQGIRLAWGGGELSIGQKKMTLTLLSTKILYRKSSEQQCRTLESTFLKLVYMSNVISRLMKIHASSTLMGLCIWNTKSRTFFLSNFIKLFQLLVMHLFSFFLLQSKRWNHKSEDFKNIFSQFFSFLLHFFKKWLIEKLMGTVNKFELIL